MGAEDILKLIDEMDNEERIKLLHAMFYKYYNNRGIEYAPLDDDY
ncbi:TPA: hypothetical protein ACV5GZ_006024 [Bacillus thuringiensis]